MEILINSGDNVDVNVRGDKGSTPLHYSACKGYIDAVKMLINFRADT